MDTRAIAIPSQPSLTKHESYDRLAHIALPLRLGFLLCLLYLVLVHIIVCHSAPCNAIHASDQSISSVRALLSQVLRRASDSQRQRKFFTFELAKLQAHNLADDLTAVA